MLEEVIKLIEQGKILNRVRTNPVNHVSTHRPKKLMDLGAGQIVRKLVLGAHTPKKAGVGNTLPHPKCGVQGVGQNLNNTKNGVGVTFA